MPRVRLIEVIWTILERKIYENNWEAHDIDHLVRRIKQKIKELDQQLFQDMIEGLRRKLRAIFDLLNMFIFCSTFHALSNRKKNIFVSIEMTTLCSSTFFQRLLHRLLYHD